VESQHSKYIWKDLEELIPTVKLYCKVAYPERRYWLYLLEELEATLRWRWTSYKWLLPVVGVHWMFRSFLPDLTEENVEKILKDRYR